MPLVVKWTGTHGKETMKAFRNILTGLLLASGLIVGLCFLHAQQTTAPIQTRLVPAFNLTTDSLWLQITGGHIYVTDAESR
jgi:hypothetical protein